jgi:hypothetical protein
VLRRAELTGHRDDLNDKQTKKANPDGRPALREAASRELRGLKLYSLRAVVAWWALVPSERRYWIGALRTSRRLRQQRGAYQIAARVLDLQKTADTARDIARLREGVDTILSRPHCGRQALYNGACFYAHLYEIDDLRRASENEDAEHAETARGHLDRARALLYAAIYDPEGTAWNSDWLAQDPDLKALRVDRRGVERERWAQLRAELHLDPPIDLRDRDTDVQAANEAAHAVAVE